MNDAAGLFRLLGDAVRLRILRLLAREKLNVSELTSVLGLAQSGISRHLKLLKEAGLLEEHREGGWAYYGVEPSHFGNGMDRLWPLLREQLGTLTEVREDDARLEEVLRQRQEDFRDLTGIRNISPGRSWAAWSRTLGYLAPRCTVADLGCGEGYLTLEVARWAAKVIAIDRSREILNKAQGLAKRHRVKNIIWKKGMLEKLPLESASVNVGLMSQVLHCLPEPFVALREANRVLTPGGTLLIQDLRSHQEEWVRERFGDVWLGFEEKQLADLMRQAGFSRIRTGIGARRRGDPFAVIIASGRKAK